MKRLDSVAIANFGGVHKAQGEPKSNCQSDLSTLSYGEGYIFREQLRKCKPTGGKET